MLSELGPDQRTSFEEFKLYYDSAEKVTDRRVDANRWNYSICTAILVALGAVAAWALTHKPFLVPAALAIVALSAMAALYCSLWIGQIRDLKELNNAKFEILNKMAPKLLFGDSTDKRVSYCPFEREWKMLKDSQAAQQ